MRTLQSMAGGEPIASALIGIRWNAAAALNCIDTILCNLKAGYRMLEGEGCQRTNLHALLNKRHHVRKCPKLLQYVLQNLRQARHKTTTPSIS